MFSNRCPNCHQGKVFPNGNLLSLKIDKMNDECPVCHTDFNVEPGFYWGAMYVSYALALVQVVLTAIVLFIIKRPLFDVTSLGIILGVMLLLAPFNYRVSRLVWLSLFAKI